MRTAYGRDESDLITFLVWILTTNHHERERARGLIMEAPLGIGVLDLLAWPFWTEAAGPRPPAHGMSLRV